METVTIILIAAAIAAGAFFIAKSKSDKDNKKSKRGGGRRRKETPRPSPHYYTKPTLPEVVVKPAPAPVEEPVTVDDFIKNVTTPEEVVVEKPIEVVVEKAEPPLTPPPVIEPPSPKPIPEPTPTKPKKPNRKITTGESLWMPAVAAKTKQIDFSQFPAPVKMADAATNRPYKKDFHVLQFPNKTFVGQLIKNSNFEYGVIYLCDKDGNVHDYAVSAEGAYTKSDTGNQHEIVYVRNHFKGGVFVVQVSNGPECTARYMDKRVLGAFRSKFVMNDTIFNK